MKIKSLLLTLTLALISFNSFSKGGKEDKNKLCFCCDQEMSCEKSSIELMFFELSTSKQGVVLKWATSYEQNNAYFNIYGSTDGYNFQYIKRINGNGNMIHSSSYKVIVHAPKTDKYYYHIEQVDFDGTTESFVPEMIDLVAVN